MEIVLEMFFLSLNNANIEFAELEKLTWKIYTIVKAIPTTSWVKLIDKSEFVKTARDENFETFVVHVAALEAMLIHFSRASQV